MIIDEDVFGVIVMRGLDGRSVNNDHLNNNKDDEKNRRETTINNQREEQKDAATFTTQNEFKSSREIDRDDDGIHTERSRMMMVM